MNTLDNFCTSCNIRFIMEDRIAKLEMLAAEQDHTIDELSQVIARQWSEIDGLKKKLEMMTKRFAALEEQALPETPVTRPPHY